MKRILIVGVSSFLGSHLAIALRQKYRLFGTFHRHHPRIEPVTAFRLEIKPGAPIEDFVRFANPDVLIYCPGVASFRQCEKDPITSQFVNGEAPIVFAQAMEDLQRPMVFFSSSKVFSGNHGRYREEDARDPQTAYGKAKEWAERRLVSLGNTITLRLGTLFGVGALGQDGIIVRLIKDLQKNTPTPYICDEYRSFVGVEEVARAVEKVIESPMDPGLFHVSHSGRASYHDLACTVAREFGYSTHGLSSITGVDFSHKTGSNESRGTDLSLDGALFSHKYALTIATMEDSIRHWKERLQNGLQ